MLTDKQEAPWFPRRRICCITGRTRKLHPDFIFKFEEKDYLFMRVDWVCE